MTRKDVAEKLKNLKENGGKLTLSKEGKNSIEVTARKNTGNILFDNGQEIYNTMSEGRARQAIGNYLYKGWKLS